MITCRGTGSSVSVDKLGGQKRVACAKDRTMGADTGPAVVAQLTTHGSSIDVEHPRWRCGVRFRQSICSWL